MQTFDAVVDDPIVAPTDQPERCRAVEKVVFSCAFPNKVPRVLGIHSNRPTPLSARSAKFAGECFNELSLTVFNRIGIVARRGGNKPDAIDVSAARVTEALNGSP